jgi:hypothetical protein
MNKQEQNKMENYFKLPELNFNQPEILDIASKTLSGILSKNQSNSLVLNEK